MNLTVNFSPLQESQKVPFIHYIQVSVSRKTSGCQTHHIRFQRLDSASRVYSATPSLTPASVTTYSRSSLCSVAPQK